MAMNTTTVEQDFTPGYESLQTPDISLQDALQIPSEDLKEMEKDKINKVSDEIMKSEYPQKATKETPKDWEKLPSEEKTTIKTEITKEVSGAAPEVSEQSPEQNVQQIKEEKKEQEGNEEVAHIERFTSTQRMENIDGETQ
jgi:hypothetical protein